MAEDEEAKRYREDAVSKLKPAFQKNGTINSTLHIDIA